MWLFNSWDYSMPIPTIQWVDGKIRIIDQTQLPEKLVFLDIDNVEDLADAIRKLKVRGAPAIGVAAGILVIFWLSLSPLYFNHGNWVKFRSPFHANLTIVIGTTVIFLLGFALSKKKKHSK